MRRDLTAPEFESVTALSDERRYQYLVKQVADWGEIWSLRGPKGWVLAGDSEGREVVPVWPHSKYADSCANEEWVDTQPTEIPLAEWLQKWIPGLEEDERVIAVFPTPDSFGLVIPPEHLRADLKEALSQMYDDDELESFFGPRDSV